VELGKDLARSLEPALRGEEVAASGSTRALAAFLRRA
jgi:hypothetical protein